MAQASTRSTTIQAVMQKAAFVRGTIERGKGWPPDFDDWKGSDRWAYERGRHYAAGGGPVPIKRGRVLRPEAIEAFRRLRADGTII